MQFRMLLWPLAFWPPLSLHRVSGQLTARCVRLPISQVLMIQLCVRKCKKEKMVLKIATLHKVYIYKQVGQAEALRCLPKDVLPVLAALALGQ